MVKLLRFQFMEADVQRSGRFGGAHLIDAVVEDGRIIHYQTAGHQDQGPVVLCMWLCP